MSRAAAPEQPSAPLGGATYRGAERARPSWWRQVTPFGDMTVAIGEAGIVRLELPAAPGIAALEDHPERDAAIAAELDEYFAGTRRVFATPVDLSGITGFRRRVLETLCREVPWGETVSYGELADMAGAPRAARAVGTTMATSPISVVVPCHRVIGADGRIGGYGGGGVEIKRRLLTLEGVHLRSGAARHHGAHAGRDS